MSLHRMNNHNNAGLMNYVQNTYGATRLGGACRWKFTSICVRWRWAVPIAIFIVLSAGCAQVEPVATESEEKVESIVSGPLPGVDSLVIQEVVTEFGDTFVAQDSELEAQQNYLTGLSLFERADSILTRIVGPSDLSLDGTASDSLEFNRANSAAQGALGRAAQAQMQQDTTLAQSLLGQAIRHYERALSFNPYHEESRYELAQVYTLRANYFRQAGAWHLVLELLRELAKLREGQHGLWAEMGVALENLGQLEAAGVVWRRAAKTVEDDSRLAFTSVPPPSR